MASDEKNVIMGHGQYRLWSMEALCPNSSSLGKSWSPVYSPLPTQEKAQGL